MNRITPLKCTVLLLLLGVSGIGVYFYQKDLRNSDEYSLEPAGEDSQDQEPLPSSILGTEWVSLSSVEETDQPLALYENAEQGVNFYYPEHWGAVDFIRVTDYDLLYVDHPRITEEVDTIIYSNDNSVADEGVPWRWLSFQEADVFSGFGDRWLRLGRYFTQENESDYCSALLTAKYPLKTTGSQAMTHCESFQNEVGHWVTHLYIEETQKRYNVYLIRFPDERYQSVAMTDLYLSEPFGKEVASELAALVMTFDFVEEPPPYVPTVVETESVVWTGDRYQAVVTQETTDGYPSWCYTAVRYENLETGEAIDLPSRLEEMIRCHSSLPWGITPDETHFLYFGWAGYGSEEDIPLKAFDIETGEEKTVMSLTSEVADGGMGGFYWNPSGNRVAFIVIKGITDDYPYGSKLFTFQWENDELTDKQKLDAKVKVGFSNEGYWPVDAGFLDDDTFQYEAWVEDFHTYINDFYEDREPTEPVVYETIEF